MFPFNRKSRGRSSVASDEVTALSESSARLLDLEAKLDEACIPYKPLYEPFNLDIGFDTGQRSTLHLRSDTWTRFAQWRGILTFNDGEIARAHFLAFATEGAFEFGRHRHTRWEQIRVIAGRMWERETSTGIGIEPEGHILYPGGVLTVEPNTWHDPVMLDPHNEIILEWRTTPPKHD